MLGKFGRWWGKTPLALLQISRQKPKLWVAILGITFADVLMFVQLGVKDALKLIYPSYP